MNRDETVKILGLVRAVYPAFHAGAAKSDVEAVVAAWEMMLGEEPFPLVQAALKAFIASDVKGFPPAIGQIKEQLIRLRRGEAGEMTETEAWALVQRALKNGIYGYRKEYDRLPETVRRCLGSPLMLHEWAQMDVDTVNSVVASNFMRSYRARAAHVREMEKLPQDVKALYEAAGNAFRLPGAEGTEGEKAGLEAGEGERVGAVGEAGEPLGARRPEREERLEKAGKPQQAPEPGEPVPPPFWWPELRRRVEANARKHHEEQARARRAALLGGDKPCAKE